MFKPKPTLALIVTFFLLQGCSDPNDSPTRYT